MSWGNLFSGIAYFRRIEDIPLYYRIAAELSVPRFPIAIAHTDICRDDLLFEIEADAVKTHLH